MDKHDEAGNFVPGFDRSQGGCANREIESWRITDGSVDNIITRLERFIAQECDDDTEDQ